MGHHLLDDSYKNSFKSVFQLRVGEPSQRGVVEEEVFGRLRASGFGRFV